MATDLVCLDCEWAGTPEGGRVFASVDGALFHAGERGTGNGCPQFRAQLGLPERVNDKAGATMADLMDRLANPIVESAPVEAVAAESIVVNGKTYTAK